MCLGTPTCYSTSAVTVTIFLSTHDARKCVEKIIFNASHAGVTPDTRSIHANTGATVNPPVECSIHMKFGQNYGYHPRSKKGKDNTCPLYNVQGI